MTRIYPPLSIPVYQPITEAHYEDLQWWLDRGVDCRRNLVIINGELCEDIKLGGCFR